MKNLSIVALYIIALLTNGCKKDNKAGIQKDNKPGYDYAYNDTPCLGALVTFTALVPDSIDDYSIVWEFGNGPVTTGKVVQHRFMKYGIHTITMTVKADSAITKKNFDIRLNEKRMGNVRKWEGKKSNPSNFRQFERISYTGAVTILDDSTVSFYGDTFVLSTNNYSYVGTVLEGRSESYNRKAFLSYNFDIDHYYYVLTLDTAVIELE